MGFGRVVRVAGAAGVAVAMSGLLTGCEVKGRFVATCHGVGDPTGPQGPGHVEVDVEVPPRVAPGATFTIRVDALVGYPDQAGPGQDQAGTLSVTGPVTPSGPIFVDGPYPEALTFTATGQPGDEITVTAIDGRSRYIGPGFDLTFDCDTTAGHVTDIPIAAP